MRRLNLFLSGVQNSQPQIFACILFIKLTEWEAFSEIYREWRKKGFFMQDRISAVCFLKKIIPPYLEE